MKDQKATHKKLASRDILFYLSVRNMFKFSPKFNSSIVMYSKNGGDGITCFSKYDSTGEMTVTRHPRILKSLIRTKGSINFQIKEWGNGLANFYIAKFELEEFLKGINAPNWILDASQRQRYSFANNK